MLWLHLGLSMTALVLILAILLGPKGSPAHRRLGRVAAGVLMAAALSSFAIRSSGHLSALHGLSVVVLVSVPYAVWQVRRGRVAAHKRIMLSVAGGLFVAGLFATFAPGRVLHGLLFG